MKKFLTAGVGAVALLAISAPAAGAAGGAPGLHGLEGKEFGKAVSSLAKMYPGAVADHVSGR